MNSFYECIDIKDLNIENCRKLSDTTLKHLKQHATKLQVTYIYI
jgi:hypothetical protein